MATPHRPSGKEGHFSVAPEYRDAIPESRDITWDDAFFEDADGGDDAGIVAVFDFDYDLMVAFGTQSGYVAQLTMLVVFAAALYLILWEEAGPMVTLIPPVLYVLSGKPFLFPAQVRWRCYAAHIAVTRDGIRYVHDRQRSGWGLSICDRGRQSKTVPFDKVTDCDIHEPAGNTCLCIPNVLTRVIVDTASSGREGKLHELEISGLRDAHSFKKLVWAMKRAKEAGGSLAAYRAPATRAGGGSVEMAETAEAAGRADAGTADELERGRARPNNSEIPDLLRDIRDELRENNKLIRDQQDLGGVRQGTYGALE